MKELEIDEVVNGDIEVGDSVLKNAPHTIDLAGSSPNLSSPNL